MNRSPLGADRRVQYAGAQAFPEFLAAVTENESLWAALSQRAAVPEDLVSRAQRMPGNWHLLVLLEDWCGDAVNIVPILARLAERTPNLALRVLRRDQHLDLMDAHLTQGKRAIPVVMVLDENFREVGWWGPRPRELQDWATSWTDAHETDRYRKCAAGMPWIADGRRGSRASFVRPPASLRSVWPLSTANALASPVQAGFDRSWPLPAARQGAVAEDSGVEARDFP